MTEPPDLSLPCQDRDTKGRWRKGVSGNPAGMPPGTRHRATRAVEAILDGEAEALTRKAVELALAGNTMALRLCLERLAPPRKDRPVEFSLPEDLTKATAALLAAVAGGELTPNEAVELARLVELHRHSAEPPAPDFREMLRREAEVMGRLFAEPAPSGPAAEEE